jgi:hypothetical protein
MSTLPGLEDYFRENSYPWLARHGLNDHARLLTGFRRETESQFGHTWGEPAVTSGGGTERPVRKETVVPTLRSARECKAGHKAGAGY